MVAYKSILNPDFCHIIIVVCSVGMDLMMVVNNNNYKIHKIYKIIIIALSVCF